MWVRAEILYEYSRLSNLSVETPTAPNGHTKSFPEHFICCWIAKPNNTNTVLVYCNLSVLHCQMMIRPLTMLLLVAPLLLSAQVSAESIEKEEMAQEFAMMLRGGGEAYEFGSNGYGYEYGDEMQHGRRLAWDWSCSWGNLLCTFQCWNAYSHHVL
jgi:hypothetical protein